MFDLASLVSTSVVWHHYCYLKYCIFTLLKNVKGLFLLCFISCRARSLKLLVSRLNEALNNAKVNRDDELRSTLILTTGEIGRYGQSLFSLLVASCLFLFFFCWIMPVRPELEPRTAVWFPSPCCGCSTACCPSRPRCPCLPTPRSDLWPRPKASNSRRSSASTRTQFVRYILS